MLDAVCANTTHSWKYSLMILRRYTGTFAFNSTSNMRTHGIELNVFRMSRLTAVLNWRFFIADAASFLSFPVASIVEQPARNPYWSALRVRFPQKCFLSCSATTCSKIFLIVSSMQSSQNEAGFRTGLPGFYNSTSRTIFHRVGNTLLFIVMLKIALSVPGLARCTMVDTLFGILSGFGVSLTVARIPSTAASISSAINSNGTSLSSQVVTTSAGSCCCR